MTEEKPTKDEIDALKVWTASIGKANDALAGERVQKPAVRALKSDWEIHRMPRTKTHVDLNIPLTANEFEALAWGHIPEGMEDHWFMFFDGEAFNFCRSWTGFTIFRVYVQRDERRGYRLFRATLNRSPKQRDPTSDEKDVLMIRILVGQLLGKDVSALWNTFFETDDRFRSPCPSPGTVRRTLRGRRCCRRRRTSHRRHHRRKGTTAFRPGRG